MKGYLLSIIGVVILGVLVDIVLPKGKMNKFIKSIFGFFTIVVIISPLPNLLNSNYDFSSLFYDIQATSIDEDFLEVTNQKIVEQIEINIVESCNNSGYQNIRCEIDSNLENNVLVIKKIKLNLKNLVICPNMVHINKYTEIVQAVKNVVNIEEDKIEFNE